MKTKKPKRRIPTAPPSKRHKSKKDYDRKALEQELATMEAETLGRCIGMGPERALKLLQRAEVMARTYTQEQLLTILGKEVTKEKKRCT
jgi:hypothetical protein